jgi:hypothetical protein
MAGVFGLLPTSRVHLQHCWHRDRRHFGDRHANAGRAKRRVALQLGSGAMHADSKQADFCSYLSTILLGGLLLNAVFGLWWMDPVAGLVMVPIIGKEGINGLRAEVCCERCGLQ